MVAHHQQNHQPGATDCAPEPAKKLPGLGRMYARDGVVTLRESPSTISSLVSLLVLISRLPKNELRVATNA